MEVPDTFKKLAASRGQSKPGAVPEGHIILFTIGGNAWSKDFNPWDWLTSKRKAETMAVRVARWPEEYPGCDGIDLDLENGAGEAQNAGTNMVHFVKKIRQIRKAEGKFRMIISQPTFGCPQVRSKQNPFNVCLCVSQIEGANTVINAGWTKAGASTGLIDSIGIMFYDGDGSKAYWPNYAHGKDRAIRVPVPTNKILLGASGNKAAALNALVEEVIKNDLGGIMIWQNSVKPGRIYWPSACGAWGCDSFGFPDAQQALKDAIKRFEPFNRENQR